MQKNNKIWDVIIIGGGASGMMAGAVASTRSQSVLIIEKNKNLGEKLKITGGGRCNITNSEPDIHKFLEIFGKEGHFLYSPFSVFGVKDTFSYFESRGLPLVTEARYRVFPKTQKASDVYEVLYKELIKNGACIKSKCIVSSINKNKDEIVSIDTNQGTFHAKSFVLATGGLSHPETGSTGDGFKFLKELGHSISDPTPGIVPLEVSDEWVKILAGVSLSFMKITFYLNKEKQFSKKGKILFTHFGLSGPLILNSSNKVRDLLYKGDVTASIDLYPDTTIGLLEDRIIKVFNQNKNKAFRNIIKDIVPEGMSKAFEHILDFMDLDIRIHSITKENRRRIVDILKGMPVHIVDIMGYDRAVVADGGVDVKEIDNKTMRSLLFKNLYITGDLLNLNRNSGGYSLQLCWTTGYVAGISV